MGSIDMLTAGSRMLKSFYRREPIISFAVTIGAVDAAIGGLNEHWSLFLFGFGTVGAAFILRWWQFQRQNVLEQPKRGPVHILPAQSSSSSLPMLTIAKKNPPRRL